MTPNEIYRYAQQEFQAQYGNLTSGVNPALPRMIAAVACCESKGLVDARNVNTDQWKSVDRGLYQINSHWHPEVADAACDNPIESTQHALRIAGPTGANLTQWACFNGGGYLMYIGRLGTPDGDKPLTAGPSLGDVGAAIPQGYGDIVGDAVGAIPGVSTITDLISKLVDLRTWIRVLFVVGGLGLVAIGIYTVANDLGISLPTPPIPIPVV